MALTDGNTITAADLNSYDVDAGRTRALVTASMQSITSVFFEGLDSTADMTADFVLNSLADLVALRVDVLGGVASSTITATLSAVGDPDSHRFPGGTPSASAEPVGAALASATTSPSPAHVLSPGITYRVSVTSSSATATARVSVHIVHRQRLSR